MYAVHRPLFLVLFLVSLAHAADPTPIVLEQALVLPSVSQSGRWATHIDAVEAEMAAGRWKPPQAGDEVLAPGRGARKWEAVVAKDGAVQHQALRGGYLFWNVSCDKSRVMMLEASGSVTTIVNGVPRAGDPYSHGYVALPVPLSKGNNYILFHVGRGQLRARLVPPKADVFLDLRDATLPQILREEKERKHLAAVLVVNASPETKDQLTLEATSREKTITTAVPQILPHSHRKVGFELPSVAADGREAEFRLVLRAKEKVLSQETIKLGIATTSRLHIRTFRSGIDGSVQYYAVVPAKNRKGDEKPALFLSLHGAAVAADGQAAAYSAKSWGHIVAPTNRRPFGFDWEDWGRLDAMEVLDLAQKELNTDPRRTYLTGHSMGGHGVWHLGLTYPDRFAALGPSAGWISFWTYGGMPRPEKPAPAQAMLLRSTSTSDTPALFRNSQAQGLYVLHGDKDDNVPVGQARAIIAELEKFHRDLLKHEQPGASHWWDSSDEDGTDCVDWGPMFDFFSRRRLPALDEVRHVQFTTVNPGVSARMHWATIEAQQKFLQPSNIDVRLDPSRRRFRGTTTNVARLSLDVSMLAPGEPLNIDLDNQKTERLAWPKEGTRLWLSRAEDKWSATAAPAPALKGPQRNGPFKEAFRNHVVFVYGTRGSADENRWALAKARFDAETFWYRGNGSIDVIPDTAFDPKKEPNRNVILYGHRDTNAAWKTLLDASPVQVRDGEVQVGDRTEKGAGLACLFVYPRPGSDTALVGVVAGTSLSGMRQTDRLAYFISGSGFPDCLVLGHDALTKGDAGVLAAGFFGNDWSVVRGDFAWAKP